MFNNVLNMPLNYYKLHIYDYSSNTLCLAKRKTYDIALCNSDPCQSLQTYLFENLIIYSYVNISDSNFVLLVCHIFLKILYNLVLVIGTGNLLERVTGKLCQLL